MSDTPTETVNQSEEEVSFFDLANQFIEVANRQLEEAKDVGEVASAFRYAAARFTAYETAIRLGAYFGAQVQGLPNSEEAQAELCAKFVEQFQDMLAENLPEQIEAIFQTEQ